jgi:hypothetical protein
MVALNDDSVAMAICGDTVVENKNVKDDFRKCFYIIFIYVAKTFRYFYV